MPGKASISLLNFVYSLDATFLGGNVALYFLHENCFVKKQDKNVDRAFRNWVYPQVTDTHTKVVI